MFGKFVKYAWPSVLVVAILAKIIILVINGDIGFYSHPRYYNFSLIMAIIGIAMVGLGIIFAVRQKKFKPTNFNALDFYVLIIVVTLFIVAPTALSVRNTERRSIVTQEPNAPSAQISNLPKEADCPKSYEYKLIETWVISVNTYPNECFDGIEFNAEAYFFDDITKTLPSNYNYFGRLVISCCVIDARPYALPIENNGQTYDKKQLYSVAGRLDLRPVNGKEIFVIVPSSVVPVESNPVPYEFRGVSDYEELQTTQ